jgi:ribosome biogenesis GTPase / thiamine phosphate phosphatase
LEKGIVTKSTGSWYTVKTEAGITFNCKIRGSYRTKGIRATSPVAVGDRVEISGTEKDDTAVIEKIEERKNYMIRRASNLSKEYQLIASNIDQAWIIVTLASPKTFLEFIDRFLVTAEAYRIPANVIFNKVDLYSKNLLDELDVLKELYEGIGYRCFSVSAKENINLDLLFQNLQGKVTLISGNSGVGKSTLINALNPELRLRTGKISDYHKTGKHTTTFAEMVELNNSTYIIDTPGIKGFGVVDFDKEEVSHFFPEVFKISNQCQFNNCLHIKEPGCAVKKAVEENRISQSRYESYLSIFNTDESRYR